MAVLLAAGCSKRTTPPPAKTEVILLRVGDLYVTAREFRTSFETSFAPLRSGERPRETYLNYLIKELLLANEGYRQGLNKQYYVSSRMKNRRYQNLLESFYEKHIQGRVSIPEEELRETIKKATVKFNLLVWPVPTLAEAEAASAEASKTDLDDYIDRQLAKQETPLRDKRQYTLAGYDYLDLPPQIFEKIKNLKLKRPSPPIAYGNGFAVFQVQNLEMQAITESQLLAGPRRKNIEERLFRIHTDKIAHAVMDSILTPMNFQVKSRIVDRMSAPLFTWIQDTLPSAKPLLEHVRAASAESKPYLITLQSILDEPLLTFNGGSKSVADFLGYMNYHRKNLQQSRSFKDFQKRLIHQIGAMIKNDAFVDIAAKEGFDDSSAVVHDLRQWEQKWIYDLYRIKLLEHIRVSDEEAKEYFSHRWRELRLPDVDSTRFDEFKTHVKSALYYEKHMQRLQQETDRLQGQYEIYVNRAVLDTLTLDESARARQITFVLTKTFTGEEFAPTADPRWVY